MTDPRTRASAPADGPQPAALVEDRELFLRPLSAPQLEALPRPLRAMWEVATAVMRNSADVKALDGWHISESFASELFAALGVDSLDRFAGLPITVRNPSGTCYLTYIRKNGIEGGTTFS
jgi:hypothetical protein